MASRFDPPTNEPDYDRYDAKPIEDVDVPDFDQPDPPTPFVMTEVRPSELYRLPDGRVVPVDATTSKGAREIGFTLKGGLVVTAVRVQPDPLDPPVDPAEHAAHALIDALTTLEQQIVLADSVERVLFLKDLTKRMFQHADRVDYTASERLDTLMERRR